MEKYWIGQVPFTKYHDKSGDFIRLNGYKWYVGPPSPEEEPEEIDDCTDWLDIILLIFCIVVIISSVIVYIFS